MRILSSWTFPSLALALLCLSCGDDSAPTPTPADVPSATDRDAKTSTESAESGVSSPGSDAARPTATDSGLDAASRDGGLPSNTMDAAIAADASSTSEPQDASRDAADAADAADQGDASQGADASQRDAGAAAVDAMTDAPKHDAAADAAPVDAGPADAGPIAETPWCGRIRCDCTLSNIPLYGRVRVVQNFPDFKVRETSFPDLKVDETSFADRCGEWEFVDAFEDFSIQWVTAFEDFSIEYSAFPGLAKSAN